tara:strand:- start:1108 stop:1629 length:522 start_codon:yes stop_codon:yes gene_type:complete
MSTDTVTSRNNVNNKLKNVKNNTVENTKLNWSFWLSIINIIGVLIAICIAVAALVIALRDENKINLFSQAASDTVLNSTNDYTTLYTYYTQANDKMLQNYSGQFEITVSNSSAIDFIITDENSTNITGNISRGANNLPTIVPFKSNGKPSQLIIKYNTSNSSNSLRRIDLNLD